MADVSQVERQIHILSMLFENSRGFTIDDILNSLNRLGIDVSKKTVERDIDYISENFYVYEEVKGNKTYYFSNKFNVPNISFDIMELISLHFTREILKSYNLIDVGITALGLIDRIVASTPQVSRLYVDTLKEILKVNVTVNNHEKNIKPEYLSIIREAIADKKSLYIEYYSFTSDEVTTREFDPYLLEIQEGCYHAVGFCHLRKGTRDFRVSRITELKPLNKIFKRPDNFYETYKQERFDKLSGINKIELKLLFKKEAARYVKEYESDRADRIIECGDGQIIFERSTTDTSEIVKWILGFGNAVEVLEPMEIREKIIEQAKEILKNNNIVL